MTTTLKLCRVFVVRRLSLRTISGRQRFDHNHEDVQESGGGEDSRAVIRTPQKLIRKLEKVRQKLTEEHSHYHQTYGVDKRRARLVIACKNPRYNHYEGQRYPVGKMRLVTESWKKTTAVGDEFEIAAHGKNPALLSGAEDVNDFNHFNLATEILEGMKTEGYKRPTRIQMDAMPQCATGRNTLIAAETGSGKTLAYAAPILSMIMKRRKRKEDRLVTEPEIKEATATPDALILAPGYELVLQITRMVRALAQHTRLSIQCLTANDRTEEEAERVAADVIVATPGALKSEMEARRIRLDDVRHVVLDEADSLLDDSFSQSIVDILADVKMQVFSPLGSRTPGAQLILASATYPQQLEECLAGISDLNNLVHVTSDALHKLQPHVTQKFLRLVEGMKPEALLSLVRTDGRENRSVLVFAKDGATAEYLFHFLSDCGVPCVRLHGRMPLGRREEAYEQFRTGNTPVAVATDLASRGLDTVHVRHVINYDFPRHLSDYIHRAGRVGRVGATVQGHVTSFVRAKWEVELVALVEEAARRETEVPNVDANIKRHLAERQPAKQE